ncbi:MAG: hypothetical protein GC136_04460 [Alphaproteobacteria bacterium]|nr:hypothetical protein [Alphaproteobacteria bacterium]
MGQMKTFLFVLFMFCAPLAAQAETGFIFSILKDRVEISSGFHGGSIVVFGVKPADGNVVLVLKGPETRVLVREKNQVLGLWMDTSGVTFHSVPTLYDFASSTTEFSTEEKDILRAQGIGLDALVFEASQKKTPEDLLKFQEAFIRKAQAEERYAAQPKRLETIKDQLFKIRFTLPATLPEGLYSVEGYLLRNNVIEAKDVQHFDVKPIGFAADIRRFASDSSFLYACFVTIIACLAGLLARFLAGARLKIEK